MVIDMTVGGVGALLAAAGAETFDRGNILECPGHFIERVDGLFDDVVAGEPGEIEPVADLPFHIGPFGLAGFHPECAGVVAAVGGEDVADSAVVEFGEGVAVAVVVAPAEAGDEGKIFLFCFFDGFENRADAGAINRDGFLAENMFSRRNGGLEMDGTEAGRRGEDDDVDAGVDDFLISVEADEGGYGGDFYFLAVAGFESGEGSVDVILEGIADGGKGDVFVGVEGLLGSAGAAPAAADEADLQQIGAGGVDGFWDEKRSGDGGGGDGCSFDHFTTRWRGID